MAGPEDAANPYMGADASMLREHFLDGTVSDFENTVGAPRFYALLPRHGIRRVLDWGCGPAPPTALRTLYPKAEIVGVDAHPEMLPGPEHADSRTRFALWAARHAGLQNRYELYDQFGAFDLIVLKLVEHYLPPDEYSNSVLWDVYRDLDKLMTRKTSIAFSVPHPDDSARFVDSAPGNKGAWYRRTVGSTGQQASMVHRSITNWVDRALNLVYAYNDYLVIIDEPKDKAGNKKRLNVLLCHRSTNTDAIYWQLQAAMGNRPPRGRRTREALLHLIGKRAIDPKVWKAPYIEESLGGASDRTRRLRQQLNL